MPRFTTLAGLTCVTFFLASSASAQCPGGVVWNGLEHCPLGQSSIAPTANGHLVVSNIGSSGQDGVRIALPPSAGNSVHSLFRDPTDVGGIMQQGDSTTTEYYGELNGVQNTLLCTADKRRAGNGALRISADFTPMASSMTRILVWDGGNLRMDMRVPNAAPVDVFVEQDICEVWCESWGDWEFTFDTAVQVNLPGGMSAFGDEVGFFPVNGNSPTSVTGLEVRAQGVPYMRYANESLITSGMLGEQYCQANLNSSGNVATCLANGSPFVIDNDVTLRAVDMPNQAFGFFITSMTQGFIANPGGSSGNLCVLGQIGRYVGPGQIQNSGNDGAFDLRIDLNAMPQPMSTVLVSPGERWYFQAWFRDQSATGPTSNFTRGLCIEFL